MKPAEEDENPKGESSGNKKRATKKSLFILVAGVEGLEPSRTVLETGMLPLHHTPKERHIKFLLSSICNIGTRLWRPLLYQLSYTPV